MEEKKTASAPRFVEPSEEDRQNVCDTAWVLHILEKVCFNKETPTEDTISQWILEIREGHGEVGKHFPGGCDKNGGSRPAIIALSFLLAFKKIGAALSRRVAMQNIMSVIPVLPAAWPPCHFSIRRLPARPAFSPELRKAMDELWEVGLDLDKELGTEFSNAIKLSFGDIPLDLDKFCSELELELQTPRDKVYIPYPFPDFEYLHLAPEITETSSVEPQELEPPTLVPLAPPDSNLPNSSLGGRKCV